MFDDRGDDTGVKPRRVIQAFGTVVAFPRPKTDVDNVIARVKCIVDAQLFNDAALATSAAVTAAAAAGATATGTAAPLSASVGVASNVHRPVAVPALAQDPSDVTREQAYEVRAPFTSDE